MVRFLACVLGVSSFPFFFRFRDFFVSQGQGRIQIADERWKNISWGSAASAAFSCGVSHPAGRAQRATYPPATLRSTHKPHHPRPNYPTFSHQECPNTYLASSGRQDPNRFGCYGSCRLSDLCPPFEGPFCPQAGKTENKKSQKTNRKGARAHQITQKQNTRF